jgi:uncharacterized protein (DUF4415 family)
MTGSKTNAMTRSEILAAVKAIPSAQDYVWDGIDEDDKPATEAELKAGLMKVQHQQIESSDKTQILLSIDKSVLQAFRTFGEDWQTSMNEALKEWLKSHVATT